MVCCFCCRPQSRAAEVMALDGGRAQRLPAGDFQVDLLALNPQLKWFSTCWRLEGPLSRAGRGSWAKVRPRWAREGRRHHRVAARSARAALGVVRVFDLATYMGAPSF